MYETVIVTKYEKTRGICIGGLLEESPDGYAAIYLAADSSYIIASPGEWYPVPVPMVANSPVFALDQP